MGSLTSQPKAPAQSPVVYYVPTPTYVPAPSAPSSNNNSSSDAPTTSPETEAAAQQQKAENLLKRSRSRLGTILTGFRGVLEQSDLAPQRKTLLGE